MNGMIQIVGYMVAAYGVTRLALASDLLRLDKTGNRMIGALGIIALALLAVMLTNQANSVASLSGL